MSSWDKVYTENKMTMWEPQQSVVQFVSRFVKKRIDYDIYEVKKKFSKVLDLGCGNGSSVHFLAKNNFEVSGVDISQDAIDIARNYLLKDKLKANLQKSSCDNLPFKNNFFDFIICFGVLDHVELDVARKALIEVKRTLKSGGLFFCTLISTESTSFGKGKKVGYNTYTIEEGMEEGEIQHYFNLEEIETFFEDFKIIDLRQRHEERYSIEGGIDRISSRWYVTMEL